MRLRHLSLTNYRNYTRLELELPARVNIFEGENAQGKTNLLEVIYYLATTKSPLATSDRELMNWNADREPIPFAQVDGAFVCGGEEHVRKGTSKATTRYPLLRSGSHITRPTEVGRELPLRWAF